MSLFKTFDVIVVGAGHAGSEASLVCARMGASVALFTMDIDVVCKMSCNPAIGGLAKGHLVREIDALGGEMGKASDATSIQSRVLNKSQGPAVWGLRAQCDKHLYSKYMTEIIKGQKGLHVFQSTIKELLVEQNVVQGVIDEMGESCYAKTVILTTGTFLNGLMHIGEVKIEGGRNGERASRGLSEHLHELGFDVGRLKTGTNPRVHRSSIDFSKTKEQWGDENPVPFSFSTRHFPQRPQVACFITQTNTETHRIISENLHRSPLFSGEIKGIGPRYCPSIEDKVMKFPDRDRHQVFLEPEGLASDEFYLNGLSTSLPFDVQQSYLHTINGLEKAEIARPGYAVEYDFAPPTQVKPTLETHRIQNLFFAGQINGTSGYEEAAAQGLMAGINATLRVQNRSPFTLSRTEAYIGVLIDDLVTKGTDEPYRMFTSRAEYRLILRPDNADLRLMEKGYSLGIVPYEAVEIMREKQKNIEFGLRTFKQTLVPSEAACCKETRLTVKDGALTLDEVLKRPNVCYEQLRPYLPTSLQFDEDVAFQLEVEIKYSGYLNRQREEIDQRARFQNVCLPEGFPFKDLVGVTREAKEKLTKIRPATIGQALRIPGITPADVTVLILAVGRYSAGVHLQDRMK